MAFLNNLYDLIYQVPILTLYFIITAFFLSTVILFLILALFKTRKKRFPNKTPMDLEAISGEDVITTQLDLARAYLEMDKKQPAADILTNVIKRGNTQQKLEAKQLINETV